ncbi:MAG: sensor histidine kinase [Proteobacteria bacterium]|nr:sensor histidine kinase [Pseudomonadota bacterium]
MDTYFAPPEKANDKEIAAEIEIVNKNPVMSGLLNSISGILAILDENRQIIALNDSFLKTLGIDDPEQALGLRLGEALECIHANEEPAGCGTTKFCSTCGAAIAIVSSIEQDIPMERLCALSANKGGINIDIVLLVKSQPIKIENRNYILLFIQDITKQEQRAALERAFYHDINNMLSMLVMASELLIEDYPSKLSKTIHHAAFRLVKEVSIQRSLSKHSASSYHPMWGKYSIEQIFEELQLFFANHPASNGKNINFSGKYHLITIKTDIALLLRVLCNMIINALEATEKKSSIKVWTEQEGDFTSFFVWNSQHIPQDIANRIFQRNFSTKEQSGRGVGTYSMKLFGEKILRGQVSFTSSKEDGTTFKFIHH